MSCKKFEIAGSFAWSAAIIPARRCTMYLSLSCFNCDNIARAVGIVSVSAMSESSNILGKVVGAYWIDYESEDNWGGTRVGGGPAPWLLKAHHKNTKIFYDRHKELINTRRIIEDRRL